MQPPARASCTMNHLAQNSNSNPLQPGALQNLWSHLLATVKNSSTDKCTLRKYEKKEGENLLACSLSNNFKLQICIYVLMPLNSCYLLGCVYAREWPSAPCTAGVTLPFQCALSSPSFARSSKSWGPTTLPGSVWPGL